MSSTFIAFFVVSTLLVLEASSQSTIKVGVYYETLCPDSIAFFKRQLYPLMQNGGEGVIEVQLVPYGKARTVQDGDTYKFTCQHDKEECEGNKMHSCAIKYITNAKQSLDFVACSMSSSYPPGALEKCSSRVGVESDIVNNIQNCSNSVEGDRLLATNGELTSALRPRLSFVPTVTFNEVYDYSKMMLSQRNFKGVVCTELNNEPDFCPKNKENRGARKVRSYSNDEY